MNALWRILSMADEIILKKIEQIKGLLAAVQALLDRPFDAFVKDETVVRAAERNFELIVELASDINTHLLIEKTGKTPDSYKQSFSDLGAAGIVEARLAESLAESAKIRNVLVHEYDFDEDYKKFYEAVKRLIPVYGEYLAAVYHYIERANRENAGTHS